jgi:hypothetical protein
MWLNARKKRILLALSGLLFCASTHAQFSVRQGTSVTIHPATIVNTASANDTLFCRQGSVLINNGKITLGSTSFIDEASGSPITGAGYEETVVPANTTLNQYEPGKLGLTITNAASTDATIINRFHTDTLVELTGLTSVKRFYTTNSEDLNSGQLTFRYDATELNQSNAQYLTIYTSHDNVITNLGGASGFGLITANYNDTIQLIAASETRLTIDSLSRNALCNGDSVTVWYSLRGFVNIDNISELKLSDGNGNFGGSVVIDTATSFPSGQLNTVLPLNSTASGNYALKLEANSPTLTSNVIQNIGIYNPVAIDNSQNPTTVCQNAGSVTLTSTPAPGIYSGSGINGNLFDPLNAVLGINNIIYAFSNSGCISKDTFSIEVLPAPSIPQIIVDQNILSSSVQGNAYQWYLDGSALTNTNNDTTIATTTGVYQVEVTNQYACSAISDTLFVNIIGMKELADNITLTVMPNPSSSYIKLVNPKGAFFTYTLFDVNGKTIVKGTSDSHETILNRYQLNLDSGMYTLYVELDDAAPLARKVIIIDAE